MEFRSTNPLGWSHVPGDIVSGVDGTFGVQLTSNAVEPVGDTTSIDLALRAKGAGQVIIGNSSQTISLGGSTTGIRLVAGQSTTTLPNMPANSQAVSTLAAAGISTGDLIICVDARDALSTEIGMAGYTCTAANEIVVHWVNPHASSITAETTGVIVRWAYLDRT